MSGRRGRSPEDPLGGDDLELWSVFTKSISPLPKQKRLAIAKKADPPLRASPQNAVTEKPKSLPTIPLKPTTPPPPALSTLDRRARKRVAKGRETIDGRLDLHGMTQAEAHSALGLFIDKAVSRGWRLVLVITGKGRGGQGTGVLRQQVPHWLSLPDLRGDIVGFEPAHVAHGGEGALYVRVRRRRSVTE